MYFNNSHHQKGRVWVYLHSTARALENVVEQISYVIIDQSAMVIHAFSTDGKQVNLQYSNQESLREGIDKCERWLPRENILIQT